MNIAFYISGKGKRFRKIFNSELEVISDTKVVFSDSSENDDLKTQLELFGIAYTSMPYSEIHASGKNKSIILSEGMLQLFKKNNIDYVFCFGDNILKEPLISEYENRIINFHPSILPMFPGRKALDAAINAKSFLVGNTAHFIDAGIDTGPIIMQSISHISVLAEGNYDSVLDLQITMLSNIYKWLKQGKISVNNCRVNIAGASYGNTFFCPRSSIALNE
jgi:phosphoribosylglycinamide formyltransferase-1